ncbi:hypothetical protein DMH04_33935 [Kibdelosporangium aridum]|uniref:DUF4386 domain-containing protein n=2 Tax=Kibdelosporangium aridum TaxID=2030 RepID=A0A428Z0V8_KIBAR|nr:hypothetical protein DMH04_33935 [Kibdelosporangium aridum]
MTTTGVNPGTRLTGVLLLISFVAMVAGAAIVAPSGLTLNPADPVAALTAVHDNVGLHMTELALDVIGWLALTAAGLLIAMHGHLAVLAGGLLAASGLAGLLHDAGNLAVTRLAADPSGGSADVAALALLTAKWGVNLAGLLWVAATVATVGLSAPRWFRSAGVVAAASGFVAVVLPWTTGTAGISPELEQLGYALHLPVMLWYAALGWRYLCER